MASSETTAYANLAISERRFFSCVPTATTQVFLTQIYSGTGSADHLSAFLIPQYAIMFLSMTAMIAYTLSILS